MTDVRLDRSKLAALCGAAVTELRPMEGGGSRHMFFLDTDGPAPRDKLVVRCDSDLGPFAGTDLGGFSREIAAYRVLEGSGLPVPALVAESLTERYIVTTRSPGSADYAGISDESEKTSVRRSYIDQLAKLHALDVGEMELGILSEDPPWSTRWRQMFEQKVARPVPVLRAAVQWLELNQPPIDRPTFCHGDLGPGNFLHEGGAVSALLDWELCHVGDRHDDLGMLTLRAHQLNGFGNLTEDLARYQEVSGLPVDSAKVRYYRAVAIVLGHTTSLMQLDAAGIGKLQLALYCHLVPTLELLLVRAMAELVGCELTEPDPVVESVDVAELDVVAALRDTYDEIGPGAGYAGVALGAGTAELLAHLEAVARFGSATDAVDLEELTALLGTRPATRMAGLRALDSAIEQGRLNLEQVLPWSFRSARRRSILWPAWAPAMAMPLIPVPDQF